MNKNLEFLHCYCITYCYDIIVSNEREFRNRDSRPCTRNIYRANEDVEVIKDLRFPRIIIALFTGAALAVSGVLFKLL